MLIATFWVACEERHPKGLCYERTSETVLHHRPSEHFPLSILDDGATLSRIFHKVKIFKMTLKKQTNDLKIIKLSAIWYSIHPAIQEYSKILQKYRWEMAE